MENAVWQCFGVKLILFLMLWFSRAEKQILDLWGVGWRCSCWTLWREAIKGKVQIPTPLLPISCTQCVCNLCVSLIHVDLKSWESRCICCTQPVNTRFKELSLKFVTIWSDSKEALTLEVRCCVTVCAVWLTGSHVTLHELLMSNEAFYNSLHCFGNIYPPTIALNLRFTLSQRKLRLSHRLPLEASLHLTALWYWGKKEWIILHPNSGFFITLNWNSGGNLDRSLL